MKIALIGYGKMGKEIEEIAIQRKHEIIYKFDVNDSNFTIDNLKKADIAIEFSTPNSAYQNYMKCFEANIPVVSGTTGWLNHKEELQNYVKANNKSFFYASNFSLGVNIFFKMNEFLAKIMNRYSSYNIDITETHHIQKKDAPSGTAITLAEDIINNIERKNSWINEETKDTDKLYINSLRKVNVPGTHTIKYKSDVDIIEITHEAKNRKGFAEGAVLAAEFLIGKKGIYNMNDLLNL